MEIKEFLKNKVVEKKTIRHYEVIVLKNINVTLNHA